jgi:hypothetical protein
MSWSGKGVSKMQEPTFIDLADAHLCTECEAVSASADQCPRCHSTALIAISRAIPRHRDSIRLICGSSESSLQMLEVA